MIDLDLLRSLVVFSEHLNLTHAARALHISQPALHAQLNKLSEQLGVTLYERRGRKLSLTPVGERVVGFGRELEHRVERFMDELHQRVNPRAVVLASGEGAFRYLLGGAIREFQRDPVAPLRLLTLRGEEMERALRLGHAQLAVTASEPQESEVTRELLTEVPMAVAMPEDHPLAQRATLQLTDLADTSLIVPPLGRPHRATLDVVLRDAGVPWRVAVEAVGWELSLHFVSLGVGLSVINAFCKPPEGVVMRALEGLPSRAYFLLRHRDAELAPAAERLRALITERADQWRDHLIPAEINGSSER